jgi:hypothetical protein
LRGNGSGELVSIESQVLKETKGGDLRRDGSSELVVRKSKGSKVRQFSWIKHRERRNKFVARKIPMLV